MTEPEYSEELDLLVEEIIDQYTAGEFHGEELEQVRNYFFKSEQRKEQLRFAIAWKERKPQAPVVAGSTAAVTQLPPPKRSLTPYLAIAAIFIVGLGVGFIMWRSVKSRTDLDRGLVAFNAAFREERPVEARLSSLQYAPLSNQRRGGNARVDYVQRDLAGSLLLKAVADNPSPGTHNALGQYYLADKQFDKAIDQFNQALALDPKDGKSHLDLGAALIEKGKLDQGGTGIQDFSRSIQHLNKGLELKRGSLEGYFNRALAYQYMMLSSDAEAAWKQYLQHDATSPWAEEAKRNLQTLEESSKRTSRTVDEALDKFRQARQTGNEDAAWKLISEHYTSAGNQLANHLLDSFLGLSSNQTASTDALAYLSYLAEIENKRTGDRYTSALVSNYSRAGPDVRTRLASARQHANTAYTLFTQSKITDAVREYTAAKEDYEKAGDPVARTFILYRLAHCYVLLPAPAKAQQAFQELLSICETNDYRWLVIQCLYGLAHASGDNSEYSKARDYSARALAKSEEYDDQNSILKTLTQLAGFSNDLNLTSAALDYLGRALALTAQTYVEPMQRWTMFAQIGLCMSSMQIHEAALLYHKQAFELAREMGRPSLLARSYGYVGSAYAALKQYPEALNEAVKGYEVGSSISASPEGREQMALVSWLLGDIQRESGHCDKAIDAYDRSIKLYRELDFEYFSYAAHKGKLFCYYAGGDDQATGNELPTVLKLFEEYRSTITRESERNSFFAMEQSVYDLAIDYEFGRRNNPLKAFEYSEASRARTLLDAVSGSTSVQEMSYGPDLSVTPGSKALSLGEIQARMPAAAQILQYAVVEHQLFIWVITKAKIQREVVNIDDSTLSEKVRSYLASVTQPPRDSNSDQSSAARELFQLLIAPIERLLDKNKFLCIVPDKILHYLPFDALVSPQTNNYLIQDYEQGIGTAPSSTVFVGLTNTAARKTASNGVETFLGVGNPRFDRAAFSSLNDLRSAVREVEAVSELYAGHYRRLIGPDATKSNIKSEIAKSDVVHLAMHYILSGKSEMLSGFPLTPSTTMTLDHNADGFWQAAEIYGLKLPRTRLALLSACQTGIEQQYDAEGAVGAARPFLVAGVPVVVATLWAVDSDASAQLMIDLHKYRTREKRPVTQALRLAKLDMLRGDQRYRHPYYWAPFVIVGGLSTF
ncbi:MAG TPA: CHAT domain-containing protein [Pyrinomonadaceae bacterium]|nr:CHAT domain-containing protein [Pyrinomonadaceae bacterium]